MLEDNNLPTHTGDADDDRGSPPLAHYPLEWIITHCRVQMELFHQGQPDDPRFCHELLRRAFEAHDPEASDEVFVLFAPPLRRWFLRHVEAALVDDLVQETFARLLEKSRQGTFHVSAYTLSQVRSFIHGCACQVVQEEQRRQSRTPVALPEPTARCWNDPGPSTEDLVEWRFRLADLMHRSEALLPHGPSAALKPQCPDGYGLDITELRSFRARMLVSLLRHRLPPDEWDLVNQRYLHGMKPRDIARQAGVEVGQVYTRLASLMRRLRADTTLKDLLSGDG
ncbi:MAG: sigma-70 family RNA polymerase sigma factor [Chloroflexaceae bacterium]|nr:sigma-70 family RNA polymerase sigma factor [Chloroflexaceae bacterium]